MARLEQAPTNSSSLPSDLYCRSPEGSIRSDFGPGLTAAGCESEVNGFSGELDSDNGDVAPLDGKQNSLNARELGLPDFNSRILSALEALYGPDSSEDELVGGTRRSERKRPTRKAKPTS